MAFAPTTLTAAEAADVVRDGLRSLASGVTEIDFGALQRFDSTAVAAILEWRRAAASRGLVLRLANLPDGLESLARLYGVAHLLRS